MSVGMSVVRALVLVVSVLLFQGVLAARHSSGTHKPWHRGDYVALQCPVILSDGTPSSDWDNGLACLDVGTNTTKSELSLPFNTDAEFSCSVAVTAPMYKFLARVLAGKAAWVCRVPISSDQTDYVPVTIALWGTVRPSYLTSMAHINLVFHTAGGFFLAGSGYAFHDHETAVKEFGYLPMRGPVRWFAAHTYDTDPEAEAAEAAEAASGGGGRRSVPEHPNDRFLPSAVKPRAVAHLPRASDLVNAVRPQIALLWVLVSFVTAVGVCGVVFFAVLKPAVLAEAAAEARKRK
ncbi:hypothetical protein BC831DRAFT_476547 [Entophlyctis helioformis]|nr:hypothetical protein BC831DRAFT_476547 [Entophlyctis helioformis]